MEQPRQAHYNGQTVFVHIIYFDEHERRPMAVIETAGGGVEYVPAYMIRFETTLPITREHE